MSVLRFRTIPKIIPDLPFGKILWTSMLGFLLLLSSQSLLAVRDSQVQTKPAVSGSSQTSEKAAKIIGPFLSREDLDEYTKVVLKNGLTVVIFERRDIPLAAITAYVKAGYLNESYAQKGVADVVAHSVLFGGKSPGGWQQPFPAPRES